MESGLYSVKPIAVWVQDGHVILWFDTDGGWYLLAGFSTLPDKDEAAATLIATHLANPADTYKGEGMWVVKVENTTLPSDIPQRALIGMHPSLMHPDTPIYTPKNG